VVKRYWIHTEVIISKAMALGSVVFTLFSEGFARHPSHLNIAHFKFSQFEN
jgi:hypothetical protein